MPNDSNGVKPTHNLIVYSNSNKTPLLSHPLEHEKITYLQQSGCLPAFSDVDWNYGPTRAYEFFNKLIDYGKNNNVPEKCKRLIGIGVELVKGVKGLLEYENWMLKMGMKVDPQAALNKYQVEIKPVPK